MDAARQEILKRLQREVNILQGLKAPLAGSETEFGLGPLLDAFPNRVFPTGAVHEFISYKPEDAACSSAFISGLLSPLMQGKRATIWISKGNTMYAASLPLFGIAADHIVFIDVNNEKDLVWVMEEALKCEGLAAVVGELCDISFTASRRLQLAVERTRVTGFVLRQPKYLNTIAAVSRWHITSLPSKRIEGLPGIGYPRWNVNLLRMRNGKTGNWQVEWQNGFKHLREDKMHRLVTVEKRKTG